MPREKTVSYPSPEEVERRAEDKKLETELVARTYPDVDGEESKALEPLVDSPALNRLLLRHARKSHVEIAAATGLPVEEVAERLSTLLHSRTWRDEVVEEQLLLTDIAGLIDDIRERMNRFSVEDEGWASMARVQLAAIKTILDNLEKRKAANNQEKALVTQAEARFFADVIKLATERAIFEIEKKYPSVTQGEVYTIFEEQLPVAIELLESRAG